jgi:hypothetical protein
MLFIKRQRDLYATATFYYNYNNAFLLLLKIVILLIYTMINQNESIYKSKKPKMKKNRANSHFWKEIRSRF